MRRAIPRPTTVPRGSPSKGRGNTDETLRQTQMIAKGNIVIKAVDGLKIDIKDVNQQSVSQTIDAMVKADPQLAWLKDAEARGDVDWRLVKEIHESFKYENSGLGPASQMIIAIVMAAVVGPAALTAFSGMGTFWAEPLLLWQLERPRMRRPALSITAAILVLYSLT